ncbi:4'-phosphopantetheinyl transferase family protein [Streptomyces sp. NPDC005780]|uniref:4'-phosphopantetheinyl transferase family protein n=1 Tax=Streptomyces sp. NPDC005780 TaxID=3364730 RepID=UPI0036A33E3B
MRTLLSPSLPSSSPFPSISVLAPGEVHVWSVPLDHVPPERADMVLDPGERARAARIRHPRAQWRYRRAHLALRTVLGGYLGVAPGLPRFTRRCPEPEVCGGCGRGRPVLVDGPWPDLGFSLSHSGAAALVGVAGEPGAVGVDVERLRATFDWGRVPAVGAQDRIAGFRTWTAVEAVGKAAGTGLRIPVSVGAPEPGGLRRAHRSGDSADWYVHDVDCPDGYVGCVATAIPEAAVSVFSWPSRDLSQNVGRVEPC